MIYAEGCHFVGNNYSLHDSHVHKFLIFGDGNLQISFTCQCLIKVDLPYKLAFDYIQPDIKPKYILKAIVQIIEIGNFQVRTSQLVRPQNIVDDIKMI